MYVECKRAGRLDEFYVFHLGWPDISARYNAVGRFGRISEVATRIAGQLSGEVVIAVDESQRSGRARLRVSAWCDPATLPEGSWRHFFTGETLPGGCERHFDCPLNEALVFERMDT